VYCPACSQTGGGTGLSLAVDQSLGFLRCVLLTGRPPCELFPTGFIADAALRAALPFRQFTHNTTARRSRMSALLLSAFTLTIPRCGLGSLLERLSPVVRAHRASRLPTQVRVASTSIVSPETLPWLVSVVPVPRTQETSGHRGWTRCFLDRQQRGLQRAIRFGGRAIGCGDAHLSHLLLQHVMSLTRNFSIVCVRTARSGALFADILLFMPSVPECPDPASSRRVKRFVCIATPVVEF